MGDMKGLLTAGAALGGSALLPALAPALLPAGLAAALSPAALGALGGALGAGAATAGQGGDLKESLLASGVGGIGGGIGGALKAGQAAGATGDTLQQTIMNSSAFSPGEAVGAPDLMMKTFSPDLAGQVGQGSASTVIPVYDSLSPGASYPLMSTEKAVSPILTVGSTAKDPVVDPSFLDLIAKDFKEDPVSKGVQLANLGLSGIQLANQPGQQRIPLQVGLPQVVSRQPRAQRQPLQRREPRRFFSS